MPLAHFWVGRPSRHPPFSGPGRAVGGVARDRHPSDKDGCGDKVLVVKSDAISGLRKLCRRGGARPSILETGRATLTGWASGTILNLVAVDFPNAKCNAPGKMT